MKKPHPLKALFVDVFTDGACSGNGMASNQGGWAALLEYNGARKIVGGFARDTTNNRMEAEAVVGGLRALRIPCNVTIHTDSMYVVYGMQKIATGRLPNSNQDIWRRVKDEIKRHSTVAVKHIPGHSGHPVNELVDGYAVECAKQQKTISLMFGQ